MSISLRISTIRYATSAPHILFPWATLAVPLKLSLIMCTNIFIFRTIAGTGRPSTETPPLVKSSRHNALKGVVNQMRSAMLMSSGH